VSGHQDYWHLDASTGQLLLQLQPAHARQADIKHQAVRRLELRRCKHLTRRAEQRDTQPHRFEKVPQRVAYRAFVIGDEDQRAFHHGLSFVDDHVNLPRSWRT
jgi:hypothetical protein